MTTTDTTVSNLIINTMTQAQYNQITPSDTELYLVTDSTITSSEVTTALGYTPENQANKVTSISSNSTDTQYPGAKCVYDNLLLKENTSNKVTSLNSSSTDAQYPSAKCVYDEIQSVKRNIGEIVTSTVPLTDAGLHLLDGALLQYGSYKDFIDYIASIYDASANYFCSESDWQTSVTTYGVCGKFVYDSTNNTVRLPKITGFVEGASGVSSLGDLTEAGLPNITGSISPIHSGSGGSATGAFNAVKGSVAASSGSSNYYYLYNFDASSSNPIYGNSTTVQPQSIKVLYYIVVANSTKTEIEVDIDEIATDLNGKADVDLSNCTKPHIIETYHSGSSWYRVYSDGWCEQGGTASAGSTTTGSVTVQLLKSYSSTSYSVFCTSAFNGSSYATNVTEKSISSFTFRYNGSATQTWYACGY